ncbi:GMC family oxidoreductase [Actinopolyspora erythraea]|uniref:Cholesterol oxidase n=1 Tax=Actinopolyspora erythraea TaxID=414996 RepID=A0A099DCM1_9ACTN|nr:GMC oxidoreductase [Actinopolyspora erythraea]ASU77127.1 GMC family oxidoreductase [Actinopolyspora erythraea]KGI83185.1 cholesterol oxidase [Actinopolyspora erythraea]
MPGSLGRRELLKGTAATAALGMTTSAAGTASAAPTVSEHRRAVVIGSGFGGSIAALRLARAGVRVLMLERGIRWPTGPNAETFPHMFSPDRRASWLTPGPVLTGSPPSAWWPYTGVLERVRGAGMDILCGSGVGGGSLVYHGMTIQPSAEHFTRSMPRGLDYERFDRDYYRRVESVLRPAGIPDDLLHAPEYRAVKQFHDHVVRAGMEPYRVPLPVDWNFARRELRGEMTPSYTTGDVLYGVNNGGKRSVDVTYLAAAEATGRVEVATLHVVRDIERAPSGKWVVRVDHITTDGTVRERKRITTDALFLGAGSAGTSRLLVKAGAKGLVPDLPEGVGTNWGNNGDRIFSWTPLGDSPGPLQGGPACMGVRDWDNPDGPVTVVHGPVPFPVDLGTTSVIGFGIVRPAGEFRYDPHRDDAVLHWSRTYDAELTGRIHERIRSIVGGSLTDQLTNLTLDTTAFDTTTFHPLGGATIGTVCDTHGRVLGQRGLYVTDGALIPGSTGACNPSMTIAALAERNMDEIVAREVGNVF